MARELLRVPINRFRGLALAGQEAASPVRRYSATEFEAWLSACENVFAPGDVMTSDGIGYTAQAAAPAAAVPRFGAMLIDSSAVQHLVAVVNGTFWDQGNLSGTWSSKGSGLSTSALWTSGNYNRQMFLGNGTDPLKRYDGTNFYNWLIAAPTTAPTLADGGAGSMTAGTYKYVYTFYRSTDGWESAPSAQGTITQVASRQVSISALQTSTDPQVDKIRIYRTTVGGATFRLLTTINNGTTTYADNNTDSALGAAITLSTWLSDVKSAIVVPLGDKLYLFNTVESGTNYRNRGRWTYAGKPYIFDPLDYTDEIDDEVVAACKGGRGIVAFTRSGAWELRNVGSGVHKAVRTSLPGGSNAWACCPVPGGLAWYDGQRFYLADDDLQLAGVSDAIDPLLRSISAGNRANTWMRYCPKFQMLVCGICEASSDVDRLLLLDVQRGHWWKTTYGATIGTAFSSAGASEDLFILFRSDGSTKNGFDGYSAAGSALNPLVQIGPTDLQIQEKKQFRHMITHIDYSTALVVRSGWSLDAGSREYSETATITNSGALLDSTFLMDSSTLAANLRQRVETPLRDTGDFLTTSFQETGNQGAINIARIDVLAQVLE